jgi:hypothetical protein
MTTELSKYFESNESLTPWSVTKINAARCPYATELMLKGGKGYDFKGGQPRIGQENLYAGIAIHELLENWHKAHIFGEDFAHPGEVIMNQQIISPSDWMKLLEEFEKAKAAFEYDNDNNPKFPGGEVVGVEELIEVDRNGNIVPRGEGYLKGTLDLVQVGDNCVTITDYKRQWNVISQSAAEDNFQMLFYSYLASCKYPKASFVTCRLYFTRYKSFVEVTRSTDAVKSSLPGIIAITEGINSVLKKHKDSAKPIPGDQCDLCSFVNQCPIAEDVDGKVSSQEEATRLASLLQLREEQKRRLTDSLKSYASKHGEITVGDKKVGYVPQKKQAWEVFDVKELLRVMYDFNINIDELFSPDAKKVNKFYSSAQTLSDNGNDTYRLLLIRLEKCIREKRKTSFRTVKKSNA